MNSKIIALLKEVKESLDTTEDAVLTEIVNVRNAQKVLDAAMYARNREVTRIGILIDQLGKDS